MSVYKNTITYLLALMIITLIFASCNSKQKEGNNAQTQTSSNENIDQNTNFKLFTKLSSEATGVGFKNPIREDNHVNYIAYEYLYNGGGIATVDVNNDGLLDLFFTANMSPNRLYINKGDLKFEDITKTAGVNAGGDWCTGVTVADVNNDGFMDIYVCRSGWFKEDAPKKNLLFINNGDLTFTEKANEYGLDDAGHSIQVSFFDYDKDGDLDMYLSNHPEKFTMSMQEYKANRQKQPKGTSDKLYRNDGNKFTDVSAKAGIKNYGWGLGLLVTDYNKDGWPDIYLSNDYQCEDFLYRNNKNGTFTDVGKKAMKHTAQSSMGVDIADINNDTWPDIMALDMLAEDNQRQKTNMASMNPEIFWTYINLGFGYQYMRNSLQLNNGNGTFSEIAQMANVSNTDWSWAALLADYDNDGYRDLFVTNGYKRDVLDKDFVNKKKKILDAAGGSMTFTEYEKYVPSTKLNNYIYQNNGNLTFAKKSHQWGVGEAAHSNGAVYADLDNDGDLDLVVNNIDQEAFIYKNNSDGKNNYLRLNLKGNAKNPNGLGTKVQITYNSGLKQYAEMTQTRGFQSACEPYIHFGLGNVNKIDKLQVIWPNDKTQTLNNVKVNQILTLNIADAKNTYKYNQPGPSLFKEVAKEKGINFKHQEKDYNDYEREVLLPHKLSELGPALAVADVNGDGLEDFFVGGASGYVGELFVQQKNGKFSKGNSSFLNADKTCEDVGAAFFDADGDKDMDLYVASGSNEIDLNNPAMQDRLYLNDGSGKFTKGKDNLPKMPSSTACVSAGDYDKDGDIDLFVGGRVLPGKYPFPPTGYLLQNDGKAKFTDVTAQTEGLQEIGMVTDALWTDFDKDGDEDLILVGEWMPITVYKNDNGKLSNQTQNLGLEKTNGWWNCISAADFDKDGDTDYVLGNLGLNSKNKATLNEPFEVYSTDFDNNGKNDIVLGYYNSGTLYPVRGRQCSSEQIPDIANKFPTYLAFGTSDLEQVYGKEALAKALHYQAYNMATSYLENDNGNLKLSSLPNELQIAPTNAIASGDFDGDGNMDILTVGNQYPVEVETGRYDAHIGLMLKGNGKGNFTPVPVTQSGFFVEGDARRMQTILIGANKKPHFLVARNRDGLLLFEGKKASEVLGDL